VRDAAVRRTTKNPATIVAGPVWALGRRRRLRLQRVTRALSFEQGGKHGFVSFVPLVGTSDCMAARVAAVNPIDFVAA
jgi:hypothetical protein